MEQASAGLKGLLRWPDDRRGGVGADCRNDPGRPQGRCTDLMWSDIRLDHFPPCYEDAPFLAALLLGGVFRLLLWLFAPLEPMALRQMWSWSFFSLALWQPFWEELLFRGVLQGQLGRHPWGRQVWRGVTVANVVTSLLFVLGHFWRHSPLWAIAVMAPSLIFGYLRDRYSSVYPSMAVHTVYNAGYFGITGVP